MLIALKNEKASEPLNSPTIIRSGLKRRQASIKSCVVTLALPCPPFEASKCTRLGCRDKSISLASSTLINLSILGIALKQAFVKVVLPVEVPPDIIIFF